MGTSPGVRRYGFIRPEPRGGRLVPKYVYYNLKCIGNPYVSGLPARPSASPGACVAMDLFTRSPKVADWWPREGSRDVKNIPEYIGNPYVSGLPARTSASPGGNAILGAAGT